MPLSNRLVERFVKATKNDSTKTKKEKIMYGTVFSIDVDMESGIVSYLVVIDGASEDNAIPIIHHTVSVSKDDRVMVTLKDNTAIITGNMSNPSIDKNGVEIYSIELEDIVSLWNQNN